MLNTPLGSVSRPACRLPGASDVHHDQLLLSSLGMTDQAFPPPECTLQCEDCWHSMQLQYAKPALTRELIAAQGPAAAHAPSPAQGPAEARLQDLQEAEAIAMSAYKEGLAAEMAPSPAKAPTLAHVPAPAGSSAEAHHQQMLEAKAIAMAAYEEQALTSDMGPSPAQAPASAATEIAHAPASAGGMLLSFLLKRDRIRNSTADLL